MKAFLLAAAATLAALPLSVAAAQHMAHDDTAAPKTPMLMEGYGTGGFKITTSNPMAQAYFTNGMQLAHAFAHKAAIEAMTEAARLDPKCAMCLWGQAWASGPTINYGKSEDEIAKLSDMADKAADLAKTNGTDRERALIHALQLRYKNGGGGKKGDLNFARSMAALASQYPDDSEVAIIAADAWLMAPAVGDEENKLNAELAMPLVQRVLQKNPNDTGAIHFYIHSTEIAGVPALAEPYADRLAMLAPKASHLVHMPSHTYYWVGRYEDAARANMRAVEIGMDNAKRLGLPAPDGVWGLPYHEHNVTFGLGGALEAGDSKIALKLGRPLVAKAQARTSGAPFVQVIATNGYLAMAQFAPATEIMALPEPKLTVLQAAWHYARGEAFARTNDADGVRREAAAIKTPSGEVSADDGSLQARSFTQIARNVLAGRAAMIEKRPAEAAIAFAEAAELQESKDYSALSDPPAWGFPIRRDLATALLAEGDTAGARRELAAALSYRPRDPGSLALLAKLPPAPAAPRSNGR